ncbi:hypothetical protein N9C60_05635 [Flavobacteriaceae bacterium]|nr:hypothetical protein [Flavobacteriaceae bacterium]
MESTAIQTITGDNNISINCRFDNSTNEASLKIETRIPGEKMRIELHM